MIRLHSQMFLHLHNTLSEFRMICEILIKYLEITMLSALLFLNHCKTAQNNLVVSKYFLFFMVRSYLVMYAN